MRLELRRSAKVPGVIFKLGATIPSSYRSGLRDHLVLRGTLLKDFSCTLSCPLKMIL